MTFLLGIDDTDTLETRGTGFHARQLAARIQTAKLGNVVGITRHQNFVHPDIPYTSQNSAACLVVEGDDLDELKSFCRAFLLEIAPEGSDVGLCVVREELIPKAIEEWGYRAKKEVLTKDEARHLALQNKIYLEGLTGTHDGIIGALAAVGLRNSGNDGRFIWLRKKKELRDLTAGFHTPHHLKHEFGIQVILRQDGEVFDLNDEVFVHDWFRPVLKNNKVTLIVEKQIENGKNYWKSASKEYIRAHS